MRSDGDVELDGAKFSDAAPKIHASMTGEF